jgi:diadenosine tetraphosphate (Ap4A) HIT family hydrolase
MSDKPCPFCGPNWKNLTILERAMPVGPAGSVAIIRPLDPVTTGHVLVIHRDHDESAAADRNASRRFALLAAVAADYVHVNGMEANIITSIGRNATQSVMHTHVHVVPRTPADHLPLPWTGQVKHEAPEG